MLKRKEKNYEIKEVPSHNSKKIKGQNTHRVITLTIFITVAVIAICNTLCILAVSFPQSFGLQSESLTSGEKFEVTILSDCVALIGLAIAVWTGLNIANSIERREVDKLQHRVYELGEDIERNTSEIEKRNLQQNQVEKNKFLYELQSLSQDLATRELNVLFEKMEVLPEVSFLKLLEIEQYFKSVYEMHVSKFEQNKKLCAAAEQGIKIASALLQNIQNITIKIYLDFRIAEFHFYMGYCVTGIERVHHFEEAIKRYEKYAQEFHADVPQYGEKGIYPNIAFRSCENNLMLSAYFCNSIGESYSKIIHDNKEELKKKYSENEIALYGLKAIFYCAYATYWDNRPVYIRNLGCAIERHYGKETYKGEKYTELCSQFYNALKKEANNVNNFKNVVSLYDKHINYFLDIKPVKLPNRRVPALCSQEFATIWVNLSEKSNILDTLEKLHIISEQTKKLHPSKAVGYQYDCVYYRDMCAIHGNYTLENDSNIIAEIKDKAKLYLAKAEENWEILSIITPYDPSKAKENPMTQILRNDLDDLKNLL